VLQPVTLTWELQYLRVREEAIEGRRRGGHVAEKNAPVLRGSIGRDQRGRGLVPSHKHLQESFARTEGSRGGEFYTCAGARYCSEGALPVSDSAERFLSGGAAAVVEDSPGPNARST
jgi:hypothetical protein